MSDEGKTTPPAGGDQPIGSGLSPEEIQQIITSSFAQMNFDLERLNLTVPELEQFIDEMNEQADHRLPGTFWDKVLQLALPAARALLTAVR